MYKNAYLFLKMLQQLFNTKNAILSSSSVSKNNNKNHYT